MKRKEMVDRLTELVATLRDKNLNITHRTFAEVLLGECERCGMLPPPTVLTDVPMYTEDHPEGTFPYAFDWQEDIRKELYADLSTSKN